VIRIARPSEEQLASLAVKHNDDALTYSAVGATLTGDVPDGYRAQSFRASIGHGERVFRRASEALWQWWPQRGSGIAVGSAGPVALDRVVALAAPLPVGYAVATCRVVAVVEEERRHGFAYGTLPIHPEEGEELFTVERLDNDEVIFRIAVFSRPHELLARVASPVARCLQAAATEKYLQAMREIAP
jgi:uncharacterized protein (UPF0548 family)